jgi:hypothetical protein
MAKKMRETNQSYEFRLDELVGWRRVEVFLTSAGRGLKMTNKETAVSRAE